VCCYSVRGSYSQHGSFARQRGPNSDITTFIVHVTDSRHCAGKAAHDHTLVEDMHINFPIENYREELERKISESVA
jgi:hypothetical protein